MLGKIRKTPATPKHFPLTRSGLFRELFFLLKVARPGFWATAAWFYLLPLGRRFVFSSAEFWLGLLYVTFPLGLIIYGWNDAVDFDADRYNPRKDTFLFGARPTREQLRGLSWRIAFVQAPFVALFYWRLGDKAIAWFATLVLACALYNWPRFGFKGCPGFDMLNQVAYLLVFLVSSWLNGVPQVPWFTFVFGALFAMHSHLFGQIMDREPDLLAGRCTTAGALDILPAKVLLVLFLATEAALVFICTRCLDRRLSHLQCLMVCSRRDDPLAKTAL